MKGEARTLQWLKGLKTNAQIFDDDEGVVAAVNRGGVATGVINNYYWARLHAELGDSATRSAIYHFGNGDVGALVNVSGAAVLKSRQNHGRRAAFLAYLVSERAQDADGEEPRRASNIRCTRASHPIRCSSRSTSCSRPRSPSNNSATTARPRKLLRQAGLL